MSANDAKKTLDDTMDARRRARPGDEVADEAFDSAYETWMRARASEGDAFALSLGYTATGWDYETWLIDWRTRHPETVA